MTTVRPAWATDVAGISGTLAAAFDGDPFVSWLLPEHVSRSTRATRLFDTLARHRLRRGTVEVAVDAGGLLGATNVPRPAAGVRPAPATVDMPYYERFGFVVTEVIDVTGGGPPLTLMWRPPR